MDTKIIKINENKINKDLMEEAGCIIRQGGLVSFPTETVYGLGADGLNPQAVEKIYKAKGRPSDNPLILHISSMDQLYPLVKEVSQLAYKIIEQYWPGPLTLIFKKSRLVPEIITAGLDSVAIRMPDNPIALDLIARSKTPIAAPSANRSGRPSPTRASHVIEDMEGRIDMIIDGGSTDLGLESTVLDLSEGRPVILRPGLITYEDLKKIESQVIEDQGLDRENEKPRSPGQKYRHYAPEAEMLLFTGKVEKIVEKIKDEARRLVEEGLRVGIMATEETKSSYKDGLVKVVGSRLEQGTIAANLFEVIREFDKEEVDIILAEGIGEDNLGRAIMNRMTKAAGGRIINS